MLSRFYIFFIILFFSVSLLAEPLQRINVNGVWYVLSADHQKLYVEENTTNTEFYVHDHIHRRMINVSIDQLDVRVLNATKVFMSTDGNFEPGIYNYVFGLFDDGKVAFHVSIDPHMSLKNNLSYSVFKDSDCIRPVLIFLAGEIIYDATGKMRIMNETTNLVNSRPDLSYELLILGKGLKYIEALRAIDPVFNNLFSDEFKYISFNEANPHLEVDGVIYSLESREHIVKTIIIATGISVDSWIHRIKIKDIPTSKQIINLSEICTDFIGSMNDIKKEYPYATFFYEHPTVRKIMNQELPSIEELEQLHKEYTLVFSGKLLFLDLNIYIPVLEDERDPTKLTEYEEKYRGQALFQKNIESYSTLIQDIKALANPTLKEPDASSRISQFSSSIRESRLDNEQKKYFNDLIEEVVKERKLRIENKLATQIKDYLTELAPNYLKSELDKMSNKELFIFFLDQIFLYMKASRNFLNPLVFDRDPALRQILLGDDGGEAWNGLLMILEDGYNKHGSKVRFMNIYVSAANPELRVASFVSNIDKITAHPQSLGASLYININPQIRITIPAPDIKTINQVRSNLNLGVIR